MKHAGIGLQRRILVRETTQASDATVTLAARVKGSRPSCTETYIVLSEAPERDDTQSDHNNTYIHTYIHTYIRTHIHTLSSLLKVQLRLTYMRTGLA